MPLSRLDNFIKNTRGNILYVNPNDLDSTDSIENQGNSLTRPFKTIQRALIEASRFSYQKGLENDRFGKTTILLYPGEHTVDNRPGWIPDGANSYKLRNGTTSTDFPQWDLSTNFDLSSENNALYKLNSIYGGVILPRGTSIVGLDLRKTKIRPKYVPNPTNDNIERSALFRVTGGCYLYQFSMFDGDPNGLVYKDYTTNTFVPNFSHHKLTCFEYADGANTVSIDDTFLTFSSSTRTDLDMYYEKVGLAYGPSSGREIEPDYPSAGLDIQPKIDEYRIVGPTGGQVGINSIKAGDGSTANTTITVTTTTALTGADTDTAIRINGITASGYDGQFVISDVVSSTEFKYKVSTAPSNALPTVTGSTVNLAVDTVASSSPYIFNCSLRSVYGMCGLYADGDKADGFKSMVLAQFTGIGLQKDNNAFVKYDETSGAYQDSTYAGNENIHSDSLAVYKPAYNNYHIKCDNNAVLQVVSVFAIGYSQHFVAKSGGDQSITNSNSNFGASSLISSGYRRDSFTRDDVGYITHVIPPKEITNSDTNIEYTAIDVGQTVTQAVGTSTTCHLYLYNQKNSEVPPVNVIEGYRIGAKEDDHLKCLLTQSGVTTQYSAKIVMPNTQGVSPVTGGYEEISSEKISIVGRNLAGTANSISSNTITFTKPHQFIDGESIRFVSDTGQLPDGVENNTLYYAVTSGVGTNQIKVASTLNDARNADPVLSLNDLGGTTNVLSRVSDKNSGDIGHPVQYNSTAGQWYINVAIAGTDNNLSSKVVSLGTTALGDATPRTFITRKPDTRNLGDTIYKMRYVIPSGSGITSARPPIEGFVLQESNDTRGDDNTEIASYFSPTTVTLSNVSENRNPRFIANATWDGSNAYYTTEVPHELSVGSVIETLQVTSTENTSGLTSTAYNNTFTVSGISSAKCFYGPLSGDPGTFSNDINSRTTSLPYFNRKDYKNTYYVYRSQQVQKYIAGEQDGIYHLMILNATNSPSVAPFLNENFSQPVKNLYPQNNRDTPSSDPQDSVSFALPTPVGEVVIDEPQSSLTKETLTKNLSDTAVGIGITNIMSDGTATIVGSSHTIFTSYDHGYNRITKVSIANSGTKYGSGSATTLYDAKLVSIGSSTTGKFATAMVSVDAVGGITSCIIMDGGSAYGVGNTMHVVGIATTTGHSVGVVSVTSIYDNAGDVIRIAGVSSANCQDYNQLYRIVGITTGLTKEINVSSASTVGNASTTGLGANLTSDAISYPTGASISVSSLTYDRISGVATVVTSDNHGLRVDNRIRIAGAANDYYNDSFVVTENVGLTTFVMNVGVGTSAPATTGTLRAYREGFVSQAGSITNENENIGGRQIIEYDGVTTTLDAAIATATTTEISLTNLSNLGLRIGDYLLIGDEIVRIKTTVADNPINVFRGILGTKRKTHIDATVVRRIRVTPVELRRNSILRASGHTFEYLGYGPGNYSTALPERQDRQLSKSEELLAQSTKKDGGVVVYTAMNSDGDFYIGNKKVSSATGQEELFDAPIPTVTGEDIADTGSSVGFDVITPQEATISRSLKVEGGPDNDILSEFDGPVVFSKKVTSTSSAGLEANHLFLQGDATVSRKYTVGIATPSLAGNPGDVAWNSDPAQGGYMGWVYTSGNAWRRFGNVSISTNTSTAIFDNVGIGTTTYAGIGTDITLKVGSGSSVFFVDGSGNVGIATTSASTNAARFKLNIVGGMYASTYAGDGSALTNLPTDSRWNGVASGIGTGVYPVSNVNVGIGTTIPNSSFSLQVGDDKAGAGTGKTDLYVANRSRFIGTADFTYDVVVGGSITATSYNFISPTTGYIEAGVTTSRTLNVGTGGTVFNVSTTTSKVGIGTSVARDTLDVEGVMRLVASRNKVGIVTSASNVLTLDLTSAQTFTCTVDQDINQVKLKNIPSEGSAFTIKFLQDSTGGFSVVSPANNTTGIETFYDNSGDAIDLLWPGGGVIPVVSTGAGKSDIYSFRTFDGGSSFYGVVGGQNFG